MGNEILKPKNEEYKNDDNLVEKSYYCLLQERIIGPPKAKIFDVLSPKEFSPIYNLQKK